MSSKTSEPMFFILGRERSGTTLLRTLLNAHKDVHVPPESMFIMHLRRKYAKKNPIHTNEFVESLLTEPYISTWQLDPNEIIERLAQCEQPTYSHYCRELLNSPNSRTKLVGDKNPTNLIFADHLAQLFPDAKFIHLVRDPRAQVNSMLKVNFERKNVTSLSIRWTKYNACGQELASKYPDRYLLVNHEKVVSETEQTLGEICQFLGIDFDESMIENRTRISEGLKAHHQSLSEDLSQEKLESWKHELDPQQIGICEKYCLQLAIDFGYERSEIGSKPSGDLKGKFLGSAYLPIVRLIYALPMAWRNKLYRRFISKNFEYWKELKDKNN